MIRIAIIHAMDRPKTIWVDVFRVGDLVVHPRYGEQRYTRERVERAVSNFAATTSRGYETTVLREHGREDSYVYGKVHELRVMGDYFQARVEFYRQEDRDAYNAGILREFSPGFAKNWLDPHTGDGLEDVLIELSFTSRAYQRNLRPPQLINPGVTLSDAPVRLTDTITTEVEMEEEEVATPEEEEAPEMDAMASIEAKLDKLIELMTPAEMMAGDEDPGESELSALAGEVARLREHNTRLELSARGLGGDDIDRLVLLSGKLNADEFGAIVELTAAAKTGVQAPIGVAGEAETGALELSAEKILEEAAGAGCEYGAGASLTLWVSRNYPDRIEEVINYARRA